MGSYQGAIAGASLRRWKKKKKKSVGRVQIWAERIKCWSFKTALPLQCNIAPQKGFIHWHSYIKILLSLSLCDMKLPFSYIWENKVFSVFTNSSPWANVCSAHRVNKNQVGALHTDSQHSQLRICIECKYWQHMEHWKIHRSGKLLCFPHTHYPSNWTENQ